eukprot:5973633-Pleurochrysis_carterae.AAC.1
MHPTRTCLHTASYERYQYHTEQYLWRFFYYRTNKPFERPFALGEGYDGRPSRPPGPLPMASRSPAAVTFKAASARSVVFYEILVSRIGYITSGHIRTAQY